MALHLLRHGRITLLLLLIQQQLLVSHAFQHMYHHHVPRRRSMNHPFSTSPSSKTILYYGAESLDGIEVNRGSSYGGAGGSGDGFNILSADNGAINRAIQAAMQRVDQEAQRIVSSLDNVNAEMLLDQPMVQQDQPQKQQTQVVNNRSRQLNNEHNNQNAHTNANNSHIRTQLQTRQHRWRREEMKLPVQVPAQSPCQQVLRVMILAFMFSPQ
mmetsp:Transcript_19130/g.29587  ORF Transcript_19130/g.29587 Transcript_19130/m.29587 type:complete len:213 (+) Transcript_19130:189-827(+)